MGVVRKLDLETRSISETMRLWAFLSPTCSRTALQNAIIELPVLKGQGLAIAPDKSHFGKNILGYRCSRC